MARLILPRHGSPPQNEGERRVLTLLLDELLPQGTHNGWDGFGTIGTEYVIIPNVEIPDSANRFLEIDAIVVAPHAVYVIETKDWGPLITGNDTSWYLNGERERPNPHRGLNYKCRVLKSLILQRSPDLTHRLWCQGVVAIARPNAELDLLGNCAAATFPFDVSLTNFIQDPMQLAAPWQINTDDIAYFQKEIIEQILGRGQHRSSRDLVIQGYQIEEQIYQEDNLVEYLGRFVRGERRGTLKRIRVFTLPFYEAQERREQILERIHRDCDALEAIGTHPNIVSIKGTYDHEADQWVEVLDWSEEGTLRGIMTRETLTLDQKVAIISGIASGLQAAHSKGIVHRDLRPENVLMTSTGPRLMNFDKAFVADQHYMTVWETVSQDADRRYLPRELSLSRDDYEVLGASDLYSLGAIFYELLCGDLPFEGPEGLEQVGGKLIDDLLPGNKAPGIPEWCDELIGSLYVSEIADRLSSAEEVIKQIHENIGPSPGEVSGVSPVEVEVQQETNSDPNRIFEVGERVGDFRITHHIKSGGFAQVYLATHTLHNKEYALKVNNQSVPLPPLIDEFAFLDKISHPNIVKVYWSGQLPGGRYYIAMEYLEGESLGTYVWGNKKLPLSEVMEVGKQIAGSLQYLHDGEQKEGDLAGKVLFHRDIKPQNIMRVSDRGYVLIDFNIAKEAQASHTFVGTGPYIAPDLVEGTQIHWDTSSDTFALGVTLYELVCKTHPYKDDQPSISREPINPKDTEGGKEISDEVCSFLLKSVQPKKEDRFSTATEMAHEISQLLQGRLYRARTGSQKVAQFELEPEEQGRLNYNPFIKRLRSLYSQASFSNKGTRGLDEIGLQTYISTRLDNNLAPAILDGQFKLIIITGNAGDGKTALIQQLEASADQVTLLPSKNGSRFDINGVPFESNYDGSQDEGDTLNDKVLEKFLAPFAGLQDIGQAAEGRILAINEGRLMEFLAAVERKEAFGWLYKVIDEYFNKHGEIELPAQLMVINLNWRSVVAESDSEKSIIEKQLKSLLQPELWTPCKGCEFKDRCFIYYNAQSLADSAAGAEIRARLAQIFEAVHLRKQLHITMRDLRSALAFLLCRDHGCEDIPNLLDEINDDKDRLAYASKSYWNMTDALSKDSGNNDRLIELIRHIDVGQVARPSLDRSTHFLPMNTQQSLDFDNRKHDYMLEILNNLHEKYHVMIPGETDVLQRQFIQRLHRALARRLYFEGRSVRTSSRLPHSSIEIFQNVLKNDPEEKKKIKKTLVQAISISEGCRNINLGTKNICIAASEERDPRWSSFRLFSASDFEITVPELKHLDTYLEHTPDRFLLHNKKNKKIVLEVNLDLFELLIYISRGFKPSLNDVYGRFIELVIFRNMLQHLPYRSVMLTQDHHRFYQIQANKENKLLFERV